MKQLTKYLAAIALFTASFAKIAASEPTFPPVNYLEVGKSYVFENCNITHSLDRYLCHSEYNDHLSFTDHICMECIWEVEDADAYGGYIIKNAATSSYLFTSDQPWSNSVYPSKEQCSVYVHNPYSSIYPQSIEFSLSRFTTGDSFLCADFGNFYTTYSGSNLESGGTYWYAYEANPDDDIILTQHKAYVTKWGDYCLSFIKPVSSNTVFSSSNTQIAQVDYKTGKIWCNAPGTTTITATCGNKSDTCSITVHPTSYGFEINNIYYQINHYLDGVTISQRHIQDVVSIENLEIPDSIKFEGFSYPVTQIGSYAFSNRYSNYNLTGSITLGKNIKSIDYEAFDNNISVVVSKSLCPPLIGAYSFGHNRHKNAVLMVPAEAIPAYSATKTWNEFKEIRSIEPLSAIAFAEANVVCPLDGTIQLKIEKTGTSRNGGA